jgi:RNA polymerase primary sigma factor
MKEFVISGGIMMRDEQSLSKYFNDIQKITQLTREEESLLARKIRNGDKQALKRLTEANLRFVISVAKTYQNLGLALGDLINEGNLGLVTAAKRFDETKGFKFISYAIWWIRQAITAALAENARMIRLPLNKMSLLTKIQRAQAKLEQILNRQATPEELAEYLGTPLEEVCFLLKQTASGRILNRSIYNSEETNLVELLACREAAPDAGLIIESVRIQVMLSLKILDKREREIVVLFFGLGQPAALPLDKISERFNLSIEHTRRLKDGALLKLRNCTHVPELLSCFI